MFTLRVYQKNRLYRLADLVFRMHRTKKAMPRLRSQGRRRHIGERSSLRASLHWTVRAWRSGLSRLRSQYRRCVKRMKHTLRATLFWRGLRYIGVLKKLRAAAANSRRRRETRRAAWSGYHWWHRRTSLRLLLLSALSGDNNMSKQHHHPHPHRLGNPMMEVLRRSSQNLREIFAAWRELARGSNAWRKWVTATSHLTSSPLLCTGEGGETGAGEGMDRVELGGMEKAAVRANPAAYAAPRTLVTAHIPSRRTDPVSSIQRRSSLHQSNVAFPPPRPLPIQPILLTHSPSIPLETSHLLNPTGPRIRAGYRDLSDVCSDSSRSYQPLPQMGLRGDARKQLAQEIVEFVRGMAFSTSQLRNI